MMSKKVWLMFLCLTVVLVMAACATEAPVESVADPQPEQQEEPVVEADPTPEPEPVPYAMMALKGPTGIGMAALMQQLETDGSYRHTQQGIHPCVDNAFFSHDDFCTDELEEFLY